MSEKITKRNVADAAEEFSKMFGANKNLYRTIASMQDGGKPGKTRLFYSWWLSEGKPKDGKKCKFKKVASVASDVMKFHPHGDTATMEVICKEGQYWNNNVMTVVPQGNFGSIRGDEHAAGRYIEAKLSEYTIDCFFSDFDKCAVPMKLAYTGDDYEPEYLPAKYPHILFNPQISGIGYGLASNIPPFNVKEVLNATIALIKDKKAKIKLIPDSPTGADIIDDGTFKDINKTGRGSFTLQSTVEIDYIKNVIKVTSLPLQTSSKDVISVVVNAAKNKQFDEIININDYTKNGEVDFRFYLRSEANPDKVLKKLYKKTDMKKTYPVDLVVIDDYKAYRYGIKQLLLEWIEYRRDIVRSMYNISLQQSVKAQHLNEVLLFIFNEDNAEKTLNICKKATSRKDNIEKLVKYYKGKITSTQAAAVCDMRLSSFNKDNYKRYKEDKITLEKEIARISSVLEDDSKIDDHIINELNEGIKKYGRPRKSRIIAEDFIEDSDYILGISRDGYLKKLSSDNNSSIGKVGKTSYSTILLPNISNKDKILLVCNNGELVPLKISDIPDISYEEIGVNLIKLIDTKYQKSDDDLEITGSLVLKDKASLSSEDDKHLIIVTERGFMKKIPLSEFYNIKKPMSIISLGKGDKLVDSTFCLSDSVKDVIVCTKEANGIRFHIKDIITSNKSTKGKRLLNITDNDVVISLSKIDPKSKYLFTITSAGRVKLTELKYFPAMKKREENLVLTDLTGTETLIGISSVNTKDIIEVYRRKSDPITINVADIKIKTRAAKGDKMIKTSKGDEVISYKVMK